MHPRAKAKRNAESRTKIRESALALAEAFELDPALVNAVERPYGRGDARAVNEMTAIGDLLDALKGYVEEPIFRKHIEEAVNEYEPLIIAPNPEADSEPAPENPEPEDEDAGTESAEPSEPEHKEPKGPEPGLDPVLPDSEPAPKQDKPERPKPKRKPKQKAKRKPKAKN